jgi:hypothetical protein
LTLPLFLPPYSHSYLFTSPGEIAAYIRHFWQKSRVSQVLLHIAICCSTNWGRRRRRSNDRANSPNQPFRSTHLINLLIPSKLSIALYLGRHVLAKDHVFLLHISFFEIELNGRRTVGCSTARSDNRSLDLFNTSISHPTPFSCNYRSIEAF